VKKILANALAALIGTALAVTVFAQPASAAPNAMDTSAAIELTTTDRADTGTGSPTVWAKDTFDRLVEVTTDAEYLHPRLLTKTSPEVLCDVVKQEGLLWKYKIVVKDDGTFKTANNSATGSPGKGKSLIKDAVGTFSGGAVAVAIAPAHWCSWTGDDYDGGTISGELTGSTSQFLGKLFGKHANVDMGKWSWTYERCAGTADAEKWVNASTGNDGDIRGTACPSPSPSPSASVSASPAPGVSTSPVAGTLPLTGAKPGSFVLAALTLLALGGLALGGLAVWNRRRMNGLAGVQ
jgi:hypothetical protein